MKTYSITTAIFLMLTLASCDKWLNVNPKQNVSRDDLFTTEKGFRDALTGCYTEMQNMEAYGNLMTLGLVEDLAINFSDVVYKNWDYENNDFSLYDNVYYKLYTIIANTNSILDVIDAHEELLPAHTYNIVKGEALALRAYLHLDIMRLYGKVPKTEKEVYLTYMDKFTKELVQPVGYEEYKTKLISDLNDAETLLQLSDPVMDYKPTAANSEYSKDIQSWDYAGFYAYRNLRLNYYAVKALKARFYLWDNDKTNAYKYAKEVIDAKTDDNEKFELAEGDVLGSAIYGEEVIFGLFIKRSTLTPNGKVPQVVAKNEAKVKVDVFENETADRRFSQWKTITLDNGTNLFILNKYEERDIKYLNNIPLIRLSEMYLIAMECGELAEANTLYETFRTSRGVTAPTIDNKTELKDILIKEYRKEFYSEGQMWFTYKRMNATEILHHPTPVTSEIYLLPIPKTELTVND